MARAAIAVNASDEESAAAVLTDFVEAQPPGEGPAWHSLRRGLALVYVLVPSTRRHWDDAELGPAYETGRRLSQALVALRDGDITPLRELAVPEPGVARAWLPIPWTARLAAGLVAAGRDEGRALIDTLGPRARPWLRRVAASAPRAIAAAARSLLADLPVVPPFRLELRVLGPTTLLRDGDPVDAPDLRRERVRAVLGYLVVRPNATREAIATALWPDLPSKSAGNNLRVSLSYLTRALEPDREEGTPAFFVRQTGDVLGLAVDEHLHVDAWELDRLIADARAAERDGVLSLALEHYAEAAGLWRGPLLDDVDAEWAELERERLRVRWLEAANRAGELSLAGGDPDAAAELARRVLREEPWSERAYRLLAEAHLARGDRAAARRTVQRCHAMLADLGVEAEAATKMLERRLGDPSVPG